MQQSKLTMALLAASLSTGALAAQTADKVFLSENIYTANPGMPMAKSMAIAGDTIICVAADESCKELAGKKTEIIDNGDATITPGLIDSHFHTRIFGQAAGVMLNLFDYNGRPTEEIEQAISDYAATLAPDEWVIGSGFSYENFPEPTKERLDELVGGRPALISDNSQHNGWYSSKALEYFGITKEWQPPKGGYMPLGEDGEPTGHLREKAHLSVGFVEQHKLYSEDKQELAITLASQLMNEVGVTSGFEAAGGSKEGSDDVYVRMAKKGDLTMRFEISGVFWGGSGNVEDDQAMIEELVERRAAVEKSMGSDSDEFLTMNTVKFAIDGTPGAYAHMEDPYLDGTHPNMNYDEDNLGWIFNELTERGFRLYLHVEGDAAIRKSLDALEYANETGEALDPAVSHVFTHIDHVSSSLLGRMKAMNITAQLQFHWADANDEYYQSVIKDNVPKYVLENSFENHGMVVASGIDYGAGADAPTSPIYKPFDQIEISLTRQPIGKPEGERLPGQNLNIDQALYGFTQGSANVIRRGDIIGSLEVGKKADIAVLDRNVHKVAAENPHALHETKVRQTILDGKVVYQAK